MRRADNLTAIMCRLSWNLGASTSWNPLGLSRLVIELFYLYLYLFYPYISNSIVFYIKYAFIPFTSLEYILHSCDVFYKLLGQYMLIMSKMGLFLKCEEPTGWEIIQEEIFPKRL